MQITVELPDDLLTHPDPAREALEAVAIAGYRHGTLSSWQTRILLGLESDYDLDGFLKARGVWEWSYTIDDFEQDIATNERLSLAQPA